MSLSDYTEEDLLEELAGRQRRRMERQPIRHHCDECRNFKAWDPMAGTPLDDFNPCQMGHRMSFKLPDSPSTYDWGFYRRVCGDRSPLTGNTGVEK